VQRGDTLGRYVIQELIGQGGMGAVYRATDPSLGRDVALKVLPASVAADPDRLERFRREARALAALNHPHIVTIYSVEQEGLTHFLTMELVSGQSLDRMMKGQPQPIDRVLKVAQALTDALVAAHDKGIVHRDLKPANIVVSDSGHTKVLDFGLAKVRADAPGQAAEGAATHLATEVGAVLGTPAYMSPEQVSGLDVDHRTDIFSLGVLLYEMVTGVRPFTGRSTAELTSAILRDSPRSILERRSSVPSEIARVISRCLEKNASARYTSMADVQHALQGGSPAQAGKDTGPSIAVLPFKNLSADADSEFFSDGLAEEILNALAQIDGLRVAARTSSFSFKGKDVDLAEIGSRLHVATVLEGSVRRSGNRIRVTAQLVDAAKGFQLWSERYDRELADVFEVQDEIARAIAGKFKMTIAGGASARLVKPATTSVEAYDLYLRGRALLLKRGRHVAEGAACLTKAVELDPQFALAWAGLADTNTVHGYWGTSPPGETMPRGLTAARKAVTLDPESSEAQCALAAALLLWERDYDASQAAFQRSLELNPQNIQARCWHGLFSLQCVRGRMAEGVAETRLAFEADPLSWYAASLLAFTLGYAGETAEAVRFARLGAEREPDALLSHWVYGLTAHWHGDFQQAADAFTAAINVSDRAVYAVSALAALYADWGKPDQARQMYDELRERRTRGYVSCAMLAAAAAAAGDMDNAIELAHEACDEKNPFMVIGARAFPSWRRLRADPRFAAVVKRLAYPAS
jgi:serine/threonine protein kinase/tetratricopeptide (TPR) repeat protein